MNKTTTLLRTQGAVLGGVFIFASMVAGEVKAEAPTRPNLHDQCYYEDGSGQRFCVWDASVRGNGLGKSFLVIHGGTDRARYLTIHHNRAYRLTH